MGARYGWGRDATVGGRQGWRWIWCNVDVSGNHWHDGPDGRRYRHQSGNVPSSTRTSPVTVSLVGPAQSDFSGQVVRF